MSNKQKKPSRIKKPVAEPLSLLDLAGVLVKHYGLTTGKYELMLEFRLGIGNVGSTEQDRLPGAMVGVSKVGLVRTEKDGPLTVDASEIE